MVLPLNTAVMAEAQLQYNAVQITPFELLDAKEKQITAAVNDSEALLGYWIPRADLEQLLDGAVPAAVLALGAGVAPLAGLARGPAAPFAGGL